VHQAWAHTSATEHDEADGLGRMPPFPMLGDKNMRFCRSLGVLKESSNTARHALYLINKSGDVVYRAEDEDQEEKVDFQTMLKLIRLSRGIEEQKQEVMAELKKDIMEDIAEEEEKDSSSSSSSDEEEEKGLKEKKKEEEKYEITEEAPDSDKIEGAPVEKEADEPCGTCDKCKEQAQTDNGDDANVEKEQTERKVSSASSASSKKEEEIKKLDTPEVNTKLNSRLSFATEEQEDEIEVHEVAEVVDGMDKEKKEDSVSSDEGIKMKEEQNEKPEVEEAAAPAAATAANESRPSIKDLQDELKKELEGLKTADAMAEKARNGANGKADSTDAAAAAKKKKECCCVIS
jgi:hypothetical protein